MVDISSVSSCHTMYTYKPHTPKTDRHTHMYTQGWQMSLHRPKQVGRQEVKDFKKGGLISPEKAGVGLISTEKYLSHLGDWAVAGEKSMKDGEHTPGKYSRWDSTFQGKWSFCRSTDFLFEISFGVSLKFLSESDFKQVMAKTCLCSSLLFPRFWYPLGEYVSILHSSIYQAKTLLLQWLLPLI